MEAHPLDSSRRIRRILAVFLSASLLAITAGAASAAPSNPSVSVTAGPPSGGSVTVTIGVDRAAKQIVSCTYGVDTIPGVECPTPVGGSKSTTYTIELTNLSDGDHTVAVAVVAKNGGVGTGSASFTVLPAQPSLFAVAFADTNGNHTYEGGTDRLVAALVDSNQDGTVSVGDTVETDAFPLTFDPVTEFGAFTTTSAPVTGVTGFTPESVQVTSTATVITWAGGAVEVVHWLPAGGGPESFIADNTTSSSGTSDAIAINEGAGLGAVPADVALSGLDQTDNVFLDVRLDLP
jgi:hypothetical protein